MTFSASDPPRCSTRGHEDRTTYARGLCRSCYVREWRATGATRCGWRKSYCKNTVSTGRGTQLRLCDDHLLEWDRINADHDLKRAFVNAGYAYDTDTDRLNAEQELRMVFSEKGFTPEDRDFAREENARNLDTERRPRPWRGKYYGKKKVKA